MAKIPRGVSDFSIPAAKFAEQEQQLTLIYVLCGMRGIIKIVTLAAIIRSPQKIEFCKLLKAPFAVNKKAIV